MYPWVSLASLRFRRRSGEVDFLVQSAEIEQLPIKTTSTDDGYRNSCATKISVRLALPRRKRAPAQLPANVGFLAMLFCLDVFTPYHQDLRVWLANLTFTTNFLRECPWPSSHLWSLAVEEQFYLVWPGLFVVLKLAGDLRRSMLVLLV